MPQNYVKLYKYCKLENPGKERLDSCSTPAYSKCSAPQFNATDKLHEFAFSSLRDFPPLLHFIALLRRFATQRNATQLMDNNYFLQTFEDVNEGTLPAPLIRHSHECRSFNNMRRRKSKKGVTSTADTYLEDPIHAEDDRNDNEEEEEEEKKKKSEGWSGTYMCVNTNKYNGKCYHKKMAVISDLHLHLTLGEALTHLLNFYLQKKIISRNFYNRLLHSFQLVRTLGGGTWRWRREAKLDSSHCSPRFSSTDACTYDSRNTYATQFIV
ncbi:conserved Plasmodium protein, unknown function [Plasmodium ovale wallikeri]|uniref:Uncharacterized protein n=1 Tax=Plasmodium ovale wallikeri TaxID=864142 RepID=A0A1A8YRN1_PLAOA|nr:conserved Plasmodium protein, unknown function [Plasmodium ovale wallikeri]